MQNKSCDGKTSDAGFLMFEEENAQANETMADSWLQLLAVSPCGLAAWCAGVLVHTPQAQVLGSTTPDSNCYSE